MNDFRSLAQPAIDHLQHELASVRTGRANPAMIEDLPVEAYGARTPLVQLATINVPEPRLLTIQPWDPGLIKDIEKSINLSSLGINPVVDGKTISLPIPAMTETRRQELSKVVQEKGEQAKIRVRIVREELVKKLRLSERDGNLSEDQVSQQLKDLQKQVDRLLIDMTTMIDEKIVELQEI